MITELLHPITQGFTLVTPTGRLSRYLQYQYAAMQIRTGKSAWETPDILPWYGWLQRTWEDTAISNNLEHILLGSDQQYWLWQEVIASSAHSNQILQPVHTARQVSAAWSLCQQWQIIPFPENLYINQDAYTFLQWVKSYQQQCKSHNWVDEGVIAEILINTALPLVVPEKIALTGFDEFTPLQQSLLNKLQSSGCEIKNLPLIRKNREITAYTYKDHRTEIHAAAIWASQLLESNPDNTIGIVVHNLRSDHSMIENTFKDVFSPANILANSENCQLPFSISQGISLQHYPVIDTALLILGLGHTSVPLEEFGSLLRSPFIVAAEQESQQRAKLDACLRKYGETRVTSNILYRMINDGIINQPDLPGSFIHGYEEFDKIFQSRNKKQPASEWARIFTDLLKAFGWPGERPLDSNEYQTIVEWQALLGRFAALDQIGLRLKYREAFSQLRHQVNNSSFQPETPEVPVQVIGMAGAAGMQFDHLRIIYLHEEVWPPKPEPNPFIPIKLQRDLNIPDASADNKLAWARNITRRLIDSSQDVVLTCPLNDRDRPLRPSPLLQGYLKSEAIQSEKTITGYAEKIFASRQTEIIVDNTAPGIPAGETASGGAGLFKDQAACPFRAFARHRLHASSLGSKDIGLGARERGLLVHDIMEKLWTILGSQQNLIDMKVPDLDKLIKNVIAGTIDKYKKQYPQTFTERFTSIESVRLSLLVKDFLKEECKRQPFTVKETEQWHLFDFNDIEIRTRVDRIDQLLDGRYVIIDYKTGEPAIKGWFDERPDEPQLPLYAINTDGEVAAIVFAKIKRGEVAYIGLAEDEDIIPGVKTFDKTNIVKEHVPDWDTLFNNWRETLNRLAEDFRNGVAIVDPRDTTACRNCDLHTFCRIYEKEAMSGNLNREYE